MGAAGAIGRWNWGIEGLAPTTLTAVMRGLDPRIHDEMTRTRDLP